MPPPGGLTLHIWLSHNQALGKLASEVHASNHFWGEIEKWIWSFHYLTLGVSQVALGHLDYMNQTRHLSPNSCASCWWPLGSSPKLWPKPNQVLWFTWWSLGSSPKLWPRPNQLLWFAWWPLGRSPKLWPTPHPNKANMDWIWIGSLASEWKELLKEVSYYLEK
jgi:hypothetical protein